ncbi:RNA-binding protein 5 [Anabrus simplex]|uniref:RNA-binding protein 5 n=1 Tax=Anabrus simplex TaxID=316456 RepID=UPI0035A3D544
METARYPGHGRHMPLDRREMPGGYNGMMRESDRESEYYHMAEYSARQAERDWEGRVARDRMKHARGQEYRAEMEDERYYDDGRGYPAIYDRRYSADDRDEWDRRAYYRDRSRDRDSRESSRRRDYRDSRRSRERVDDGKDGRPPRRKSSRDRDRREPKSYDKDYDRMDHRERRRRDDWSPDLDYDIHDYHGMRGYDSRYNDDEDYKSVPPNTTIMVRNLPQHIIESDIRQDIQQCGMMPKDIRLIRKKDTGASRGFAFVEFNTLQEASQWMNMKKGVLMFEDQYRALMHFSIHNRPQSMDRASLRSGNQDWQCTKCGAQNFKRRDTCYKCHSSRQESEGGGEWSDEISPHPTHTVLLRGLDVLSTEDSVLEALQRFSQMAIRSIRIGQDPLTNTSRGICYVELNNVMDAVFLHDSLLEDPLVVDGKKVTASFYKLARMKNFSSNAANPPFPRSSSGSGDANANQFGAADIPRLAEYSASLYASSTEEHAAYVKYYTEYYENQLAQEGKISLTSQTQTDSVNAAAAVAQLAIRQVQAAKGNQKQVETSKAAVPHAAQTQAANITQPAASIVPYVVVPTDGSALPKYPVPDVSSYQYDETSGYYYDSQTGLYYDASSQYYYNATTQQFLYWEGEKQTYMPYPPTTTTAAEDPNASKDDGKKKDKDKDDNKEDKVKVAKRIAKDMARWAKTLNQKKDYVRQNFANAPTVLPSGKTLGAADAGYAILERKERQLPELMASIQEAEERQGLSPSLPQGPATPSNASGLVAAYGGGSDSEDEIEDVIQEDRQHTNWVKLACLLCKRQFPSKESLMRHQQLSDLHKQNLDNWYRSRGLDPSDPEQRNNKYRDRARERRLKFGVPNDPNPNPLKEKYLKAREEAASISYEEPTKAGIGTDNVGNKLLQKMGWKEGQGLGKANQGRTQCIQTAPRVSTAGLGAAGSSTAPVSGVNYKDCVKKRLFARYHELDEQSAQS